MVENPILPAAWLFILGVKAVTAVSMAAAAFVSPRVSSIMAPAQIAAIGLMTLRPVYLGAEPPMGSNMLRPWGLMLPPAAMPMPPCVMAPRSVMMSPKRFSVTMTSNHSGFLTIHIVVASTWQ